jgi:hypothetical protein
LHTAYLEELLVALLRVKLIETFEMLVDALLQVVVDIKRRRGLVDVVEHLVLVVLPCLIDDAVSLVDLSQVSQNQRLAYHLGNQL